VPVGPFERFSKRKVDAGLELVELVGFTELKEFEAIDSVEVENGLIVVWVEGTPSEDRSF